ncbi:MAG: hypothetical protein MUF54_20565 [Polyangiaceae bacterium]|jgi:hypothetical protein|nr:hypothetical protein [Polyangiaceae bacterium]
MMLEPDDEVLHGEWEADDAGSSQQGGEAQPVVPGTALVRACDRSPLCGAVLHVPPFTMMQPERFRGKAIEALWLTVHDGPWRSLAILSTCDEDTDATVDLAMAMAQLGNSQQRCSHFVSDSRGVSLPSLYAHTRLVQGHVGGDFRIIVALGSPQSNPVVVPAANALDAIVVCVSMGRTRIRTARETVEKLLPERLLGAIALWQVVAAGERKPRGHVLWPSRNR